MVIWKEKKHEDDDSYAAKNVASIAALWSCGLLKFFNAPSMVSHVQLLEHILWILNPEKKNFQVGPHILTIEVEDIYFLTGLFRHGVPISLTGSWGEDITTQELP